MLLRLLPGREPPAIGHQPENTYPAFIQFFKPRTNPRSTFSPCNLTFKFSSKKIEFFQKKVCPLFLFIRLPFIFLSKFQKSSFMYVTYCKLCPLSSIITENVFDVCKHLQVMSFSPNSVNFCG
ncbi:hypothetical protein Hanom_Chr00s002522g01701131 [Helianthus anomalus]